MPPLDPARSDAIRIRGARQNNLKNLDLDIPLHELVVVTGVSGSGKSSLVFDTLYAEGQRRYVETFSPYARQFLDRMDRPLVDHIEGIPPAIAIDQTNPVRTSRSTVGTMTELNDHLKLLFARAAHLHCRVCGRMVRRDTPESILKALAKAAAAAGDPRLLLSFPVPIPKNFSAAEIEGLLSARGYTRIHERRGDILQVIQDRFRLGSVEPARVNDAIEAALKVGQGRLDVYPLSGEDESAAAPWRFSTDLHCADCDIAYKDPSPSTFSFNSPIGACDTCRGFGRSIGVDYGLVIPDTSLSLREGAIKPWQTESYRECQADLLKFGRKRGIPIDTPWRDLTDGERAWVLDGEGEWTKNVWYGVKRFFAWLETKAYKMHIRVLLSRYRSYTECTACGGARLKPEALLWRVGNPGVNIRDVMLMPIDASRRFFAALALPAPLDEATELLLREIRARLKYLTDVGLGYLDLDRQSRTLSGGEVQRINLTTALGTSLVNTLFVLDEPSIGLHARDVGRIVGVMQRLRDAGNTLLVVEHDPKVMQAADRVIDIGPGPGEHGGHIVFDGPAGALREARGSLTADYLFHRRRVEIPAGAPRGASAGKLRLEGAAEHNLKNIDVDIPLGRLVCVAGVSGSGKSTLVHDVLYPALRRAQGKPTENPGRFRDLQGIGLIGDVVMVDQSRIGRTTRSNPASYVGAFDAIRTLFAKLPQARERKYTAGTFSFNAGNGRCPGCGGNGFEHVEMQFLSDVYLRCPDCDGRRYRAEILECKLTRGNFPPMSIADVLDLTVSEALTAFAADAEVCTRLAPLAEVGLDYLRLGQPVPTLSGGEAQRLKLAGHLAENTAVRRGARAERGSLFLFDEPTTGLHFDDVAKLLRSFRRLIEAGHSLLVIEHNLDVVRASDWVIELGPEGGDAGGLLVGAGAPEDIMRIPSSHTGRALLDALNPVSFGGGVQDADDRARRTAAPHAIEIRGAREHNLKNIDVHLEHDRFTVITGVSGSGKSTLAFDILFAEGQRRYLESLNAYARQFVQPASRPDVDAIFGIPPTVAIEQRTSRGGRKSTVATLTEIYHFLRLLYVKLGRQFCPSCEAPIEPQSVEAIAARLLKDYRGQTVTLLAPLIVARKGLYTALAKWARGKGYRELRVDGALLPTAKWPRLDRFVEHNIELPVASLGVSAGSEAQLREALASALDHGRGVVHVQRAGARGEVQSAVFSTKRACPNCGTGFPELDPRLFSFNSRHGWCPGCFGTGLALAQFDGEQSGEETQWRDADDAPPSTCTDVRRRTAQSGRAARAVPRPLDRGAHESAGTGIRRRPAQVQAFGSRICDRPRLACRADGTHLVPLRCGSRLSAARPCRPHAVRRRSAAHSSRRAARFESAGSVLRARRADDRPAPARQRGAARHARSTARQGQYAGRRRARRGYDSPRRSRHRSGPRRRDARRPGRGAGHRRAARAPEQLGDRALPCCAVAPFARAPPRGRARDALDSDFRRDAAQSMQSRCAHPPWPADRRHGRIGIRQVLSGARCAPQESGASRGPPRPRRRRARTGSRRRRLRIDHRLGIGQPRARGRSNAHRQDTAFLPGHLHRILGLHPPALCGNHRRPDSRLHGQPVLIQHRRRALRSVRGAGYAAHRDEFPARRASALRRVRRASLQSGDPGDSVQGQEHRRHPRAQRR